MGLYFCKETPPLITLESGEVSSETLRMKKKTPVMLYPVLKKNVRIS